MSSMQAALGLAQTERLDELIARKREIFDWYAKRLADVSGISLNNPGPDVRASYWMVSAVWDEAVGMDTRGMRTFLGDSGIDTRPFFSPLSSLAAYKHLPGVGSYREKNTVSYRLKNHGINLPSSLTLKEAEVAYVCKKIREVIVGE